MAQTPEVLLGDLLAGVGLGPDPLEAFDLSGTTGLLTSSFEVGLAAQVSVAAAAVAANEIARLRSGERQGVTVSRAAAELECTGYFELDGVVPKVWDDFAGIYATSDGHVRLHTNFEHHRDGALALLGLSAERHTRDDVAAALLEWNAQDYEDAAARAELVVSKVRTFEEWDAHPHALANAEFPPVRITRVGAAPPRPLPPARKDERPLAGLRCLDLTRILAGPICGRTLAAYGAEVLLVNGPHLPNIDALVDTSRGKRSAHVDLRSASGCADLHRLLASADAFIQGYRPGGLAALGFGVEQLAERYPGLVLTSLSAYGPAGPWADRRGFDSLVQSATGFNRAEQAAFGSEQPKPMPVQILDYASGFLMAFGTQIALLRRATEGGSWHVEVSLLHTANWLRRMGRTPVARSRRPDLREHLQSFPCTSGELRGMPHGARFDRTPAQWLQASTPPGTAAPSWGSSA